MFFLRNFVNIIREGLIIEGPTIDGIVGDLPAINIHRGRDHGLQTFVKFREIVEQAQAITLVNFVIP